MWSLFFCLFTHISLSVACVGLTFGRRSKVSIVYVLFSQFRPGVGILSGSTFSDVDRLLKVQPHVFSTDHKDNNAGIFFYS